MIEGRVVLEKIGALESRMRYQIENFERLPVLLERRTTRLMV